MLISYPLLPASQITANEADKLTYMVRRVRPDGAYPIGYGNRWHGGIHLEPDDADEPIRAIADGEVVAYRLATEPETYPAGGRELDTSFVLIRHSTESGEHTQVEFYSLYMHLRSHGRLTDSQRRQLPAFLRNATPGSGVVRPTANTRVWRKEILGLAGSVYGNRRVHFEIFATQTQCDAFWRDRSTIVQGQHGTTDVFGDIHFIIPASRSFLERHPRADAQHRIDLAGPNNFYTELPVGQAGRNDGQALHVVVNLANGVRTATTFRILENGTREQIHPSASLNTYEYNLYSLAEALYPDCPSAGFEYLRFGRVLGPDRTNRNENWQLVRYADNAMGYIDLAAADNQVSVLSDADFPLSWQRLDEGQTAQANDGICDVPLLLDLIGRVPDTNGDGHIDSDEWAAHAARPQIAEKLRFLICKHPSEWDAGDLATRYARQRTPGAPLAEPTAREEFDAHVRSTAFWAEAGLTDRSMWHFHPLQFIRHYRKCGWLSEREMIQMFPRSALRNAGRRGWVSEGVVPSRQRLRANRIELNKATRKYAICTPKRLAAFYGNAMQETQWFGLLTEPTDSPAQRYSPWVGRGMLQLTWPDNYIKYWRFRGRTINEVLATDLSTAAGTANRVRTNAALLAIEPRLPAAMSAWREAIGTDRRLDVADSAGAYWSWSLAAQSADRDDAFVRATIQVSGQPVPYYTHAGFGRVAATVNVGQPSVNYAAINGVQARFQAYTSAMIVLGDRLQFPNASGQMQETPEGWERRLP